jgi:DNA-binding MarR family transcriptional regulator
MPRPQRPPADAADALVAVGPLISRWIERLLAGHDPPLTPAQFLAMRAIARGEKSGSELARRAGVSGPAVSQLLAGLSRAGLLERRVLDEDRRRQSLALSCAGTRVLASAQALLRRRLSAMLAHLPAPEADALVRVLAQVDAALSGEPPPRRPPPPGPPPALAPPGSPHPRRPRRQR